MKTPRDAGLQPERTVLAWNRTAAAMAVNAIVLLRAGFQPGAHVLLLPGALLAGFALALLVKGRTRRRQLLAGPPAAPSTRSMGVTSAAVVVAALCAVGSMRI